ncbi:hypothetical protein H8D79_01480 [PVC group bacterium]|nr:hypothetical protein [PVC group bacterium]
MRPPTLALVLVLAAGGCATTPPTSSFEVRIQGDGGPVLRQRVTVSAEPVTLPNFTALSIPFISLNMVRFRWKSDGLGVSTHFDFLGGEDPDRRVLAEFRTYDPQHREMSHDWRMTSDDRLGARRDQNVAVSGRRYTRLPGVYVRFLVPHAAVETLAAVEIAFREMRPKDWRHFPPRPDPEWQVTMTRPDESGRFEVSFRAPRKVTVKRHVIALVVREIDASGTTVKQYPVFSKGARANGHHRFTVKMEPENIDRSSVMALCYRKRRGFDPFRQGGGRYSGNWWQRRYPLIEVPFE